MIIDGRGSPLDVLASAENLERIIRENSAAFDRGDCGGFVVVRIPSAMHDLGAKEDFCVALSEWLIDYHPGFKVDPYRNRMTKAPGRPTV